MYETQFLQSAVELEAFWSRSGDLGNVHTSAEERVGPALAAKLVRERERKADALSWSVLSGAGSGVDWPAGLLVVANGKGIDHLILLDLLHAQSCCDQALL